MKDSAFNAFIRKTFSSNSPIPYIITIQVALSLFLLIFSTAAGSNHLLLYSKFSLPTSIRELLLQPWSIITFAFSYNSLLPLLFDCLWLYWIGNLFLNLLNPKQFSFVFFGSLLIGAVVFLVIGSLFSTEVANAAWSSTRFGIAAILASLIIISPHTEVRFMLFGNITLKTIAIIYFIINIALLIYSKEFSASLAFISSISFGILYSKSLQQGNDWSELFSFKKKKHLKIIHGQNIYNSQKNNEFPNQEIVDKILDKISVSGYDSLTKNEKETLFRASKKD